MSSQSELLEKITKLIPKSETIDLEVKVETTNDERDYRFSKRIINAIKPIEEEAKQIKRDGTAIYLRIYKVKGSPQDIAVKILTNINECYEAILGEKEILIKDIVCPPCNEGAKTYIQGRHYLLPEGRIVEQIEENRFKIYTCRVQPP